MLKKAKSLGKTLLRTREGRFVSFVVIPLVLAFYIFPYEKIKISKIENSTETSVFESEWSQVDKEKLFAPSPRKILAEIIEKPTGLDRWRICFLNKDAKIIYPNGSIDTNVDVFAFFRSAYFNKTFKIPYKKEECVNYKWDEPFSFKWKLKATIVITYQDLISGQPGRITFEVETYAVPEPTELCVKLFIAMLAFSALFMFLAKLYYVVMFGKI